MRQLKWSQNKAGTLNGKVGHVTLFTIAYYPERGYFISPKLPGLNKTIPVISEEAGKREAETLYQRYFEFLKGDEWYREHKTPSKRVTEWILGKRLIIFLKKPEILKIIVTPDAINIIGVNSGSTATRQK